MSGRGKGGKASPNANLATGNKLTRTRIFCRALERVEPSVTARFFVTTFKVRTAPFCGSDLTPFD
jgi:hypothetical protein